MTDYFSYIIKKYKISLKALKKIQCVYYSEERAGRMYPRTGMKSQY